MHVTVYDEAADGSKPVIGVAHSIDGITELADERHSPRAQCWCGKVFGARPDEIGSIQQHVETDHPDEDDAPTEWSKEYDLALIAKRAAEDDAYTSSDYEEDEAADRAAGKALLGDDPDPDDGPESDPEPEFALDDDVHDPDPEIDDGEDDDAPPPVAA